MTFLDDLNADIEFLHRDEYMKKYSAQVNDADIGLPAIFVKDDEKLKLWVDNKVINEMLSTDDLMEMIRAAVLKKQAGVSDKDDFLSMPV